MSWTTWENELYHHGIKGQKWGQRRFQNEDGTLTEAGLLRYSKSAGKTSRTLNRLDQDYADNVAYQNRYQRLANRQNKKLNKIINKTLRKAEKGSTNEQEVSDNFSKQLNSKNGQKIKKVAAKMKAASDRVADYKKQNSNIEKMQWQLIAKAAEKGWKVSALQKTRYGATGFAKTNQLLNGLGSALLNSVVTGGSEYSKVEGRKFKVKK